MSFSEVAVGEVGEGEFLSLGDSGFGAHLGLGYDKMISPNVLVGALARVEFSDLSFGVAGSNLGETGIAYLIGARAGWVPREDALIYVLLGYKWSDFDLAQGLGSIDPAGWVVGGGLELMLTDHVFLGAEYATTLLDNETVDGVSIEPTDHAARLRLGYKW
jgi:opacity protein-like surface antigen